MWRICLEISQMPWNLLILNLKVIVHAVKFLKIDKRSRIEGTQIISFMKLESISVAGKDANQSGVGKKFLIISISLTVLLNLSIAIWFFMNDMGRFLVK